MSLRVDAEVLEWYCAQGRGYQSLMNAVLRSYMDATKRSRGSGR
ncbi:MAG TPA: BrnA antitoxin family protein [Acidobacteriota bacterium]|nr:BrnA antitoxin family protein [Acidobacteriota bacterium]